LPTAHFSTCGVASGVFTGRAFGDSTPNFYETHEQCIDVCCKAFCCRHINFKTVFQRASKHITFIQKIEKFSGGTAPSETPPEREGHFPRRLRRLNVPLPKSQIRHWLSHFRKREQHNVELNCLLVCQVNGESVLRFEYNTEDHSETVFDHQHNELLLLHYDSAGRVVRVVPRTHLDALNVTYDRQGRWTRWSRGDLTVTRVFDEPAGRLVERTVGSRTGFRYVYRNTSKASQCYCSRAHTRGVYMY